MCGSKRPASLGGSGALNDPSGKDGDAPGRTLTKEEMKQKRRKEEEETAKLRAQMEEMIREQKEARNEEMKMKAVVSANTFDRDRSLSMRDTSKLQLPLNDKSSKNS